MGICACYITREDSVGAHGIYLGVSSTISSLVSSTNSVPKHGEPNSTRVCPHTPTKPVRADRKQPRSSEMPRESNRSLAGSRGMSPWGPIACRGSPQEPAETSTGFNQRMQQLVFYSTTAARIPHVRIFTTPSLDCTYRTAASAAHVYYCTRALPTHIHHILAHDAVLHLPDVCMSSIPLTLPALLRLSFYSESQR